MDGKLGFLAYETKSYGTGLTASAAFALLGSRMPFSYTSRASMREEGMVQIAFRRVSTISILQVPKYVPLAPFGDNL